MPRGAPIVRPLYRAIEIKKLTDMANEAVNWNDAKYRVLKSYREWLRAVSLSSILEYPPGVLA